MTNFMRISAARGRRQDQDKRGPYILRQDAYRRARRREREAETRGDPGERVGSGDADRGMRREQTAPRLAGFQQEQRMTRGEGSGGRGGEKRRRESKEGQRPGNERREWNREERMLRNEGTEQGVGAVE